MQKPILRSIFTTPYLTLPVLNMRLKKKEGTQYAPALRSSSDQLMAEHELILTQSVFTEILGSVTGIGAIINKNREIVFANEDFLKNLGLEGISSVLGKRTGEIISCINAENNTGGCGTSLPCANCGAVNAIIESQRTGQKSCRDAFITTRVNGKISALDIRIISVPVIISATTFYLLIIQDISHEKRREALERIFLHDLLNSACALNGLLTLLRTGISPDKERKLINLTEEASRDIIDEIQTHKQLLAAENGDLEVIVRNVSTLSIVRESVNRIIFHKSGYDKQILIHQNAAKAKLQTDKVILERVMINLLKNALEATPAKGRVLIGVDDLTERVRFWVKNDQIMSSNTQMQLFQRSFSTKGTGRGLGTYSIRLLTENYLNGSVSFVSNEKEGTIFEVILFKKFSF